VNFLGDRYQKFLNATQWSTLRAFGNYPPTKMTVFIPVIGYLILFNENVLQYLGLSRRLFGYSPERAAAAGAAPVSPRLLFLYFGLCLISAGSIIFSVRCPPRMKAYGSPTELIEKEHENLSLIELRAIATRLDPTSTVGAQFTEYCSQLINHRYGNALVRPAPPQRDEELEADGILTYYNILNNGRPISRIATALLFLLGLVLVSVPTIEVFLRVVMSLF
jgi:hypothetical protein